MGVKNLSKILKKFCPDNIVRTKLPKYANSIVGIDASIFFYKNLYVSNMYNKPNHYLQLFFQQIIGMIEHNIIPIYIFDGEAPDAKQDELLKRTESRSQRSNEIEIQKKELEYIKQCIADARKDNDQEKVEDLKLEFNSKKSKLKKKQDAIIHVTETHKLNLKKLLTILAIPYIQGYEETDPLTAQLCKDGLVDFVMSEDMDYLPLQCPKLIRTERSTGSERWLLEYDYKDIIESLGLSETEFTDLCILCGCDYVDQLYKVGPLTAIKLIREHKSIEVVLQHIDKVKHKVPENYMDKVSRARLCFLKTYTHRIKKEMLCRHEPNIEKLQAFMDRFCSFGTYMQQQYLTLLKKKKDNEEELL
jgi:flap endonuclease-1